MDKMVEIARFTYPSEAGPLMALLESEGIECYLRNELTSQLMAGYVDVGGARLEILEKDYDRALELMREGGYAQYVDTAHPVPARPAAREADPLFLHLHRGHAGPVCLFRLPVFL